MSRLNPFVSLLLAVCLALGGCTSAASPESPSPPYETLQEQQAKTQSAFDRFCQDLFRKEVTSDTLTLHYTLAEPEAYQLEDIPATFGKLDEEDYLEEIRNAKQELLTLSEIDPSALRDDQRQTFEILTDYLCCQAQGEEDYLYQEPLSPQTGIHVQLPILLAEYPLRTPRDVEQYLMLLEDIPRYFGHLTNFERAKSEAGLFMADALADQVIQACNSFASETGCSVLTTSFSEKLHQLTLPDSSLYDSYLARHEEQIRNSVIPAYRALASGISSLKRGENRNLEGSPSENSSSGESGLCHMPGGENYYRRLVRRVTGSERSPEEMISWLEKDIASDTDCIRRLLRENPDRLKECLDFSFPETEPEQILENLKENMQQDFPACPKTEVEIQVVPEALKDSSSPAFYLTPPIDSPETQKIYINPRSPSQQLYPTLAHEGYPGHMFQNVYFTECRAAPIRYLLNYPGYSEGWATYVEQLSYSCSDSGEPEIQLLIQTLQDLNLKVSALADLYVHEKGYSEEELAEFLSQSFGIDKETGRKVFLQVLGNPANYLKYVIGYMEFSQLRQTAEEALGDDFVPKSFHQFLLDYGPAPFSLLQEALEVQYIPDATHKQK